MCYIYIYTHVLYIQLMVPPSKLIVVWTNTGIAYELNYSYEHVYIYIYTHIHNNIYPQGGFSYRVVIVPVAKAGARPNNRSEFVLEASACIIYVYVLYRIEYNVIAIIKDDIIQYDIVLYVII